MTLDVVFTPQGLSPTEVQGRTVFVIDILRLATTVCAALHHGAKAIVPVASTEEAIRLQQTLGSKGTVLAGERNCVRMPGFALGNSPREMTPDAVRGKLLIMTTTNGTAALLATQGAQAVYPVAAANFSLASARAREVWETDGDLLVVCAGREHRFALDDAYCAGRVVAAAQGSRRMTRGLTDAALAALDLVRRYGDSWDRPLTLSKGGRELIRLGFQDDVVDAARMDAYPVLALYHERRITAVPPAP